MTKKKKKGKVHFKHSHYTSALKQKHSTQYCNQDVQCNPIWVREDSEDTRLYVNAAMFLLKSSRLKRLSSHQLKLCANYANYYRLQLFLRL